MSNLQSETLQSTTPATAQPTACTKPEKTITINHSDALDSALRDLRKAQSTKRALESALSLVIEMIGDNQRLVERLKAQN